MTVVKSTLKTCNVCQVEVICLQAADNVCTLVDLSKKKVIDLVGPLLKTRQDNQRILVLTNDFTRWLYALPISDATAPTVATTLDERVFYYFGLLEQIHSDLERQIQSQLMELCVFM